MFCVKRRLHIIKQWNNDSGVQCSAKTSLVSNSEFGRVPAGSTFRALTGSTDNVIPLFVVPKPGTLLGAKFRLWFDINFNSFPQACTSACTAVTHHSCSVLAFLDRAGQYA